MKVNSIHPNYKTIMIQMTDGTKFFTRSTGKNRILDVDVLSHPAWTKNNIKINKKDTKVVKFEEKFSGLSNYLEDVKTKQDLI